ncbi:MAG: hypothetical protein KC432_14305, partial [Thermomicrobiales bacterium]|nr:hypothetical protein [Thermomicrobiales bacterium]
MAIAEARGRSELPHALTRLIGRETESADLVSLLTTSGARLVTLTGPGGIGKTHLAIDVARKVDATFADGAVFVPLAAIRDPGLVLPTVARSLAIQEVAGQSIRDHLANVLSDWRALLILDNLEHLLAAATDLAFILEHCPGITMLVTSRAPLRIRGEREYAVPALPVPDAGDAAHLAENAAVQLFIERARSVDATFALDGATAPIVGEICRRLDGLPLAIELAAARTKVLAPAAMLARLDHRLPLLIGGARDLPDRLRTMRDAIAWSYDLLTPDEQQFFRQLAVFVGGFTLDAAETVTLAATPAPATQGSHSSADVIDQITALIDQSLLQGPGGSAGEPRYSMLETVREFGLERLAAAGETEDHAVRAAHAAYMQSLTEPVHDWPFAASYVRAMARLDVELANVRAALEWADREDDAALRLRLAGSMAYFWMMRGHFREGFTWLERTLLRAEAAGAALDAERARALNLAGALASFQGDGDTAATLLADAIRLAQAQEDWLRVGMALGALGLTELQRGNYQQASQRTGEAISLLRRIETPTGESRVALSRTYANL